MSYINLDGKITAAAEACVPYDNRAFRYGYGLFETMLVRDGHIALWPYHAERLAEGMKQLRFDIPAHYTPVWLEEEILKTARKNQLEKFCRVRLQVYAGSGNLPDGESHPQFLIECFALEQQVTELNKAGLITGVATGLAKSPDSLSNIKTTNALLYAAAAQQAKANNWNDALVVNTAGNIIESAIANIFWTKNDIIYTPPLSEGCIAGVMRRQLLHILPEAGYPAEERELTRDLLFSADAVFLTNAIRKIKWIRSIDGKEYGMHIIPDMHKAVS